jgi:hypothetical protein
MAAKKKGATDEMFPQYGCGACSFCHERDKELFCFVEPGVLFPDGSYFRGVMVMDKSDPICRFFSARMHA